MAPSKDSSPAPRASSPPEEALPAGFSTIRHILDLPNDVIRAEAEFNVFGVLKDFQVPFQTKGTGMSKTPAVPSFQSFFTNSKKIGNAPSRSWTTP